MSSALAMLLCVGLSLFVQDASTALLNEFDTYNADECQRVRRPWNTLTPHERDLYISGILKIRENGQLDPKLDDFIAISGEHEKSMGSDSHLASIFFFWHGYLLYELESRIRALGGKYKWYIRVHMIHV